ncbi:MAG: DUF1295 domain-containing protein, partial [Mycetocola sp.]
MSEQRRPAQSLIAIVAVVVVGALIAWAGSVGSATINGVPLFATAVALAFVIQWIAFIPAFAKQTERFFDLTGSLSYISITLFIVVASPQQSVRGWVLAAVVVIWAVRLGSFLFQRIHRSGSDDRFDEIKPNLLRFLTVWTVQGLWVSFTAMAAWVAISSAQQPGIDAWLIVGVVLWVAGFAIEVIADQQKTRFKADPANEGRFISTGLWSRSRHPNYFGEILLWVGVAVMAIPTLVGWQFIAL